MGVRFDLDYEYRQEKIIYFKLDEVTPNFLSIFVAKLDLPLWLLEFVLLSLYIIDEAVVYVVAVLLLLLDSLLTDEEDDEGGGDMNV